MNISLSMFFLLSFFVYLFSAPLSLVTCESGDCFLSYLEEESLITEVTDSSLGFQFPYLATVLRTFRLHYGREQCLFTELSSIRQSLVCHLSPSVSSSGLSLSHLGVIFITPTDPPLLLSFSICPPPLQFSVSVCLSLLCALSFSTTAATFCALLFATSSFNYQDQSVSFCS